MRNCNEKSCHCQSQSWIFNFYEQSLPEVDIQFGKKYRKIIGDFVRSGKVEQLKVWSIEDYNVVNYIDRNGIISNFELENCDQLDEIDMYTYV